MPNNVRMACEAEVISVELSSILPLGRLSRTACKSEIMQAIKRGVSEERIARTLNVER